MNAPAKDLTTAAAPAAAPVASPAKPSRMRKTALMLSVPLLLAGGVTAYWFSGAGTESTENANLHQARISVAPTVGGRVVSVNVTELQQVKAGDILFQVEPEPYKLALAQAETAVNGARLQVEQMKAAYSQAVAQVKLAQDDAAYLNREYNRQQALAAKGVATPSDVDSARHLALQGEEKATLAELNVTTALAALGGVADSPTDRHPSVAAALVELDRAKYNLSVTTVTAPADGVVYQAASFREGAMLSPGQSVFALVENGDVWVDANFKETQLSDIAVGQPAEVTFDMAPGRHFSGTVEAIGAGTGAEFSLLPAQNATGNWVKVTQRVPVRIRLDDPAELAGLSSGLSAEVTVDTSNGQTMLSAQAAE
ncbi:HlyD family secretion protein (plasmid) [Gemmobacter aquarius]|uniref:HlyD family secretion protein n=1 Tax=Paragemmobacter aquarius TaxID=2169400 RepID=A0A2S0URS7_9RHOB|nr:HlyD family secretion protein [Gemmobacter aquarius]AWB50507.1 HlyD family secretion protein [Gemmobacter aquarius]